MDELAIIVLAAGLGKRMGSELPKALTETIDGPMLRLVLKTAQDLGPRKIVVVTGHGKELVEQSVSASISAGDLRDGIIEFAVQAQQLGTGDATKAGYSLLKDFRGTILILYSDSPLLKTNTIRSLLNSHSESKATISLISAHCSPPSPYGRIIRDKAGQHVLKIVEARDCSPKEVLISETNTGVYAVEAAFLGPALDALKNENAQGEYYLTDIVEKAAAEGQTVVPFLITDPVETQGVNTRSELLIVNEELRRRRALALIEKGVRIIDPNTVYIDQEVSVEAGAVIGPNVQLYGKTVIEKDVTIEGTAFLRDVTVRAGATIKFGVKAESAEIGKSAAVGPFAHLRPGTDLGREVKIGNFVETKNAIFGEDSKASHLSYIGDASIGSGVNIGAGVITCNYDGVNKHQTIVEDDAFIGTNSALIAPLRIGKGAFVGAGSTVSKDVAAGSLAFTRAPLKEKKGWSDKKFKRSGKD